MKDSMNYSDLLQHPKWQKMRLKILERDEFVCQSCFDDQNTLHVHHRYYFPNRKPWEYPPEALITLCKDCHKIESENIQEACDLLIQVMREKFLSTQIENFAIGVLEGELSHVPDVVSEAFKHAFLTPDIQKMMIDLYFEYLKGPGYPPRDAPAP